MRHQKHHYPYLFSLALRTNPFDEEAMLSSPELFSIIQMILLNRRIEGKPLL